MKIYSICPHDKFHTNSTSILRAIAMLHIIHSTQTSKVPYVRDVIHERIAKHHTTLEDHLNPLLEPLIQTATASVV
jgi:hypothetical protein